MSGFIFESLELKRPGFDDQEIKDDDTFQIRSESCRVVIDLVSSGDTSVISDTELMARIQGRLKGII